jgi:hypothetical protein
MREAVEFAAKQLITAIEDDSLGGNILYLAGCMRIVANKCKAALAEPLRNCDVGTAEEQGKRLLAQFDQWKRKNEGKQVIVALMEWAQSPYEKGATDEQ